MRKSSSRSSRGGARQARGQSGTGSSGKGPTGSARRKRSETARCSDHRPYSGDLGRDLAARRRRCGRTRGDIPLALEVIADALHPVHVPAPVLEHGPEPRLEIVHLPDHAVLQVVRLPAPVDDVQEDAVSAAEGDLVPIAELDAPDAPDAEAVEGVVHEVLDRAEHRCDQVGVLVRLEAAGEVDHRRPAGVGQVDVLDRAAMQVRELGHDSGVVVPALIPSEAIIPTDSRRLGARPNPDVPAVRSWARGSGVSYLVIIGGALIAVQGILDILNIVPAPPPDIVRPYLAIVGVVSVISGVLAIIAGWLILQRKKSLGSPLAIVFSIIGFAGGGGFIIGTVLGLIGGVMNFRRSD